MKHPIQKIFTTTLLALPLGFASLSHAQSERSESTPSTEASVHEAIEAYLNTKASWLEDQVKAGMVTEREAELLLQAIKSKSPEVKAIRKSKKGHKSATTKQTKAKHTPDREQTETDHHDDWDPVAHYVSKGLSEADITAVREQLLASGVPSDRIDYVMGRFFKVVKGLWKQGEDFSWKKETLEIFTNKHKLNEVQIKLIFDSARTFSEQLKSQ